MKRKPKMVPVPICNDPIYNDPRLLNGGQIPYALYNCTCGQVWLHVPTCPWMMRDSNFIPVEDQTPAKSRGIVDTGGEPFRKPRPSIKKGKVRAWPKSYQLLLAFSFTKPINIAMWKHIKAPAGWVKNPTSRDGQQMYRGVRFRCTDLKYALTPDAVEDLRAKLYLSLELT